MSFQRERSCRLLFLSSIALLMLAVSCGSSSRPAPAPRTEEVLSNYQLYVSGDYAAYVASIQSNDGKPDNYLRQMEWLMQQHAEERVRETGGIAKVSVERIEQSDRYANAFLDIVYKDSSTEEILLPLVYVDGKWRIK